MSDLSSAEFRALEELMMSGGSFLITRIPDKNEKSVFGEVIPGMSVYKKLEKKDLIFFTQEDPIDDLDGFAFTQEVYITDKGIEIFKRLNNV